MAAIAVKASDTQDMVLSRPTPEISALNYNSDTMYLKALYAEFEQKRKELYDLQFRTFSTQEELTELQTKHDCITHDMRAIQQSIKDLRQNGNFSQENGVLAFEITVVGIVDYYGVKWSDMQISECSQELYQNYHWLQIGELKLFVAYVKNGVYREAKNLAPYHLLQWIDQFANESLRIREQATIIEANNLRYDERWGTYDDRGRSRSVQEEMDLQKKRFKNNYIQNDNNDGK